jgi:hypothetical protein
LFTSVNDIGEKFIAGVNNSADWYQLWIYRQWQLRQWLGCVGCLWTRLFIAVRMKLSAAVSNFGGWRFRRFGLK